jgi:hypothetical protein
MCVCVCVCADEEGLWSHCLHTVCLASRSSQVEASPVQRPATRERERERERESARAGERARERESERASERARERERERESAREGEREREMEAASCSGFQRFTHPHTSPPLSHCLVQGGRIFKASQGTRDGQARVR